MQCASWIKQLTTLKYDYKVIHGGRSSGKTVGASQGVVLLAVQSKVNFLCGRQFLNSIADSIKSDIEQVIAENNLNSFFTITDKDITGANGSYISFAGFDRNVESIKGKTKFDYTVIDEAQTLSRKTLDILTPTIRKDGSQIWFILNRTNISDPVDYDFIQNTPDNCWVKYLTYEDNPFHGEKSERERVRF
jgi:phage terminase large subunit